MKTKFLNIMPSETDAIAGTPQITGTAIESYPVTGTGEAWVRVYF